MERRRVRYKLFGVLAVVLTLLFVVAACGGGEEAAPAEEPPAATTEEAPPATEEAPPATEEAPPAETEAAPAQGGLVESVEVPGVGTIFADPAQIDPAVQAAALDQENWAFPVTFIDCTSPDVDPNGCVPKTPDAEIPGVYTPLPVAEITQPWNVCVSFPHLKDAYWVASNYGVVAESGRDGIKMQLVEAGGYTNLAKQLSQLDNCVAQGAQAVVLSAISYDGDNAKADEIVGKGIFVIDHVNGISSSTPQARSMITYYKMGYAAGEYLAGLGQPVKVAWFPGPPGAGWVETSNQGFVDATAGSQVEIVDTKYGDTGKDVQLGLIENVLEANPDINYIAGNAVAAEAAVSAVAERGLEGQVGIVADYLIPTTFDFIEEGKINCSPSDQNVMQGRIAIDQAVRLLEGKPLVSGYASERAEPHAVLVCGPGAGENDNLDAFVFNATFAPPEFKPTFTVG